MFFDNYPEFIESDNRSKRIDSQVTSESMSKRCEAFLPKDLIQGKTILDLGCCVGAMGHWCLSNGASHYTGVEAQAQYSDLANHLLSKHHQQTQFQIDNIGITSFLLLKTLQYKWYDVVICLGVIYAFVDPIKVIHDLTRMGNVIVIDAMFPVFDYGNNKIVELIDSQKINTVHQDNAGFTGAGSRITPSALEFLMQLDGFTGNRIFPDQIYDAHDPYNDLTISKNKPEMPSKFAYHFKRDIALINSKMVLENNIVNDNKASICEFQIPTFRKNK